MLLSPTAAFALATQLRTTGAPIGDVFSFLSGLYFRGKLGYARAFGVTALVMTSDMGLVPPERTISRVDIERFATVDLAKADQRFLAPLRRDAEQLDDSLSPDASVVLLGSIASDKYVGTLLDVFGERLLFPSDFVGRGDMSRGGLLLRQVASNTELEYVPVLGAVRHGARPPRLDPKTRP